MKFLPIEQTIEENPEFANDPSCQETFLMTINFYKKIGFNKPWICYYAHKEGKPVGSAGFKGKPVNNTIEIAYGTFDQYQKQGIGTEICRQLVSLALVTDPNVRITARTLPEKNYSTKILEKNNFKFIAAVDDPEDGTVWEWEYSGGR